MPGILPFLNLYRTPISAGSVGQRLSISGKQILDYDGTPLQLRGINFGTYDSDQVGDSALVASYGANVVRYVAPRWKGVYSSDTDPDHDPGDVDAYDASATSTALIAADNLATIDAKISEIKAAGHKLLLAFDSNCGQNGLQPGSPAYCDPGNLFPTTGRNFWADLAFREEFFLAWEFLTARYLGQVDIYELLPEPLDGRDATYADDVRDFYHDLSLRIKAIDPQAIFLVGPRDGYNINLAEEAYDVRHDDYIYTGNMLNAAFSSFVTLPQRIAALIAVRDAHNVPIMVQQVGRNTDEEFGSGLEVLNMAFSIHQNNDVHYTYWQLRQHTAVPTEYAWFYEDGIGGFIEKTDETDLATIYFNQDLSLLEAEAVNAATAAGATLFYVKSDFSNVWSTTTATAGTNLTAVGQAVARIDPVVGSGFNLSQTTSGLRPLLVAGAHGYAMDFDGTDDYLTTNSPPYVSGDANEVIAAGTTANSAANRIIVHCGTSATNPRYPYMGLNASDIPFAAWRGNDTTNHQATGTITSSDVPVVIRASKQSTNLKVFLNGMQDGTTTAEAVDTLSSITRMRVGASTTGTTPWNGPINLLCFGETMTDAQIQAIERFAAYLCGSYYTQSPPPPVVSESETTFDPQFTSYSHIGETNTVNYTRPSRTKPATKATSINAPNYVSSSQFAEQVYKVTLTSEVGDGTDAYNRNHYSKTQYFNCDNTMYLSLNEASYWFLYDAETFDVIPGGRTGGDDDLGLLNISNENVDPMWHPTNPNLLRFAGGDFGTLIVYEMNVLTGSITDTRNFTGRLAAHSMSTAAHVTMGGEGRCSDDGSKYCFTVYNAGFTCLGIISYNWDTDTILGSALTSNAPNWTGCSPDGSYFIVQWHNYAARTLAANSVLTPATRDGTVAYNATFSTSTQLDTDGEHGDVGADSSGLQYWLSVPFSTRNESTDGIVYSRRMDTGGTREYTGVSAYTGNDVSSHFNGTASIKPGWMLMDFHGGTPSAWKDGVIMAIHLESPYEHVRLGFHYCDNSDYRGTPFCTVNKDFTRILFGSWGSPYEMFMLVLPSDWTTRIP